jgi:hypothetical protein
VRYVYLNFGGLKFRACGVISIVTHQFFNLQECTNVFSSGGGESMAKDYGIPFLGRVPIDPQFTSMVEADGEGSYVNKFETSNLFPTFQKIAEQLTSQTTQQ